MINFYPRSPCGERRNKCCKGSNDSRFLSTLSLRRATLNSSWISSIRKNFYPRSPCGERPRPPAPPRREFYISIHALLAESDPPRGGFCYLDNIISIHALLAESDSAPRFTPAPSRNFYPRSPCGERRSNESSEDTNDNFYPRSPCGERPL